jgi:hypothetical protein
MILTVGFFENIDAQIAKNFGFLGTGPAQIVTVGHVEKIFG